MKIYRLKKGEKVVESLTKFVDDLKIKSGSIQALGALSQAEIMVYKLSNKQYVNKIIEDDLEVGGFFAIIAKDPEGNTHLHPHIIVSNDKFQTFCGHLKEATVAATFEFVISEGEEAVERYHDSEIGLNLIK